MKEITGLLSRNLSRRCKAQMGIQLKISPALKEYLVKKHADRKMGARPLKRAIQSEVEDALAEEILQGGIKRGDSVTAGCKGEKVTFTVTN